VVVKERKVPPLFQYVLAILKIQKNKITYFLDNKRKNVASSTLYIVVKEERKIPLLYQHTSGSALLSVV